MSVLQVVQAHHQPRGDSRSALPAAIVSPEMLVEAVPVYLLGQLHQRVSAIEQVHKSRFVHT